MTGFVYSLLRFSPNPATGEFVNLGAIAGSDTTGDWAIRHVQNDQRARSLAGLVPISVFYEFYERLADEVEGRDVLLGGDEEDSTPLTHSWLADWAARARNVVQLSRPQPLVASSAEAALDVIFDHMIEDPARSRYRFMTRRAVFGEMRRAYLGAGLKSRLNERCLLQSGSYRAKCDFVVGKDEAIQLAHSYSFGIASQAALASEVKAWGWTMADLRKGGGEAVTRDGERLHVDREVDIEVLYAVPEEGRGLVSLDEAKAVFAEVGIRAVPLEEADQVASRAVERVDSLR